MHLPDGDTCSAFLLCAKYQAIKIVPTAVGISLKDNLTCSFVIEYFNFWFIFWSYKLNLKRWMHNMRYCQSVQLGCTHCCKVRSSSKWHPCKAASMILILQVSLFLVGVGNVFCTLTYKYNVPEWNTMFK